MTAAIESFPAEAAPEPVVRPAQTVLVAEERPSGKIPKIGVMLATPVRHYNGIQEFHPKFKEMLNRLAELSSDPTCPYEFMISIMEGGLVRARNHIAHEFKRLAVENPSLKFLISADDDLELEGASDPAEAILRLLAHKKPFVAALYTTREETPHYVANFMHEVTLQPGSLLQVIEVGTGLTCTHIKIFTELDRLMPDFRYTDRDSGERVTPYYQHCMLMTDLRPDGDLLPEDYFFCHLLRRLNIGMFVDTTLKLKHRGRDGTLYPTGDWPPVPIDGPEVEG